MKQTAVEWLQEKLNNVKPTQFCSIETIKEWVDQAKEMEKEQITDAFAECWKANVPNGIECKLDAEQYYNEIFNTKEK